jgi:hypothetical protein
VVFRPTIERLARATDGKTLNLSMLRGRAAAADPGVFVGFLR